MQYPYKEQESKVENGKLIYAMPDTEGVFVIPEEVLYFDLKNKHDFTNKLRVLTAEKDAKVYDIDDVFINSPYLTKVDLSNATSLPVITEEAFSDCALLKEVILPTNITNIYSSAFTDCYSLEKINLQDLSSLEEIDSYAFNNCDSLKDLDFPDNLKEIGERAFFNSKGLKNLSFTNCTKLNKISNQAFAGCDSLENVKFSNSINKLGYGVFNNCDSLTKIDIPKDSVFNTLYYSTMLNKGMKEHIDRFVNNIKLDTNFYVVDNKKDIKNFFKLLNNEYNDKLLENNNFFYIKFNINNLNDKNLEYIKEMINKTAEYKNIRYIAYKKDLNDINQKGEKVNYIYTKDEFIKLDQINTLLQSKTKNTLLYQEIFENNMIKENINAWNHLKVKKANKNIKKIANYIKHSSLTPFEAMIYIHNYCANFKYKGTDEENKKSIVAEPGRNIVEIFNEKDPYIVCVSYASLEKAIIDELDMPGLKCEINSCLLNTDNSSLNGEVHINNVITLKDKQYLIDGKYMEDSCFDSIDKLPFGTFGTCLYSLNDLKNLKKYNYQNIFLNKESIIKGYDFPVFSENDYMEENNLILEKEDLDLKENTLNFLLKLDLNDKVALKRALETTLNYYEEKDNNDYIYIESLLEEAINFVYENKNLSISDIEKEKIKLNQKQEYFQVKMNAFNENLYLKNEKFREIKNITENQINSYKKEYTEITLDMIKDGYLKVIRKMNLKIPKEKVNKQMIESQKFANTEFNNFSKRNSENVLQNNQITSLTNQINALIKKYQQSKNIKNLSM